MKLLVGLKINKEVIDKMKDISVKDIADWFTPHHNGCFVIGLDSKYFGSSKTESKPHYHIHFFTDSKEEAVKTMKSKKLADLKSQGYETGGRTTKMYIPKDKEGADPLVFIAYAIKEQVIWSHDSYKTEQMELLRHTQLEVKRLRSVYQSKEQEKKDTKKEFKELMYEFIKLNWSEYIQTNEGLINNYGEVDNIETFRRLCIKYLIQEERYGSIKKCFIDIWYMEYLVKYLGGNEENLYLLIFPKF